MKVRLLIPTLMVVLATMISSTVISKAEEQPQTVSLVQILASSEKYDGKFLRVEGFLHNKFEDSGLYLSQEDADHLNGRNGIWVSYHSDGSRILKQAAINGKTTPSQELRYFDGKRVLLEGYLDSKEKGHRGAFAATLKNVTRIMEQKKWYDGEKELP